MKSWFFELCDTLQRDLRQEEALLCSLSAERSDFVRFNRARVRQAGTVEQRSVSLRLIRARRQASASVALSGGADDLPHARSALARLRDIVTQLPEDPWLLIADEPNSTSTERRGAIAHAEEVVQHAVREARESDFVGFYAAGTVYRAFANSFGQRNWHEVDSFNFDWSAHLRADKAVKGGYAGVDWEPALFEHKIRETLERLTLLQTPPVTLDPGEYRVYLAPHALEEVAGLLQLDAFSARSHATRQSPLLRMEHGAALSPRITISENTEAGMAPQFQQDGFVKPGAVTLIHSGKRAATLVSPRSAREYGLESNAANGRESPESLDWAAGTLEAPDTLRALENGLYVGNLWYLNFSDRPAGRMTGMTRFATFLVKRGKIVSPVNPVRFDDTVYRMLGANLVDLTRERELVLSTSTYGERSTASARLPGALIQTLRFTL